MKNDLARLALVAIACAPILVGCDNIPDCGDAKVTESVVNLAEGSLNKGLKPSEQEALSALRTTKLVATLPKTKEGGVRICNAKILITFNGPVSDLLQRMTEDGEKIADEWESAEKAKLDDLRKRTLGIPPYSPLDTNAEIASRYADANMAFMKSSGELKRQIKTLREVWSSKAKGIEFVSDYKVSKESSSGQFTVELAARELAGIRDMMPLVLRAKASMGSPAPSLAQPASTEKIVVALKPEMDYVQARDLLKKSGWTPARGDFEKLGIAGQSHYKDGLIEVAACADTGLAQCKFVWLHDSASKTLTVQTSGESPKVTAWSVE